VYIQDIKILLFIAGACVLTSCNNLAIRNNKADNFAISAGFNKVIVITKQFKLFTFQKINNDDSHLTIYIEGDGLAYLDRYRPSLNPTPTGPISLKLAVLDPTPNVLYIARPCQYVPREENPACNFEYWTFKRYAPEVLVSINETIDLVKKIIS